jgi:hypothetical protein
MEYTDNCTFLRYLYLIVEMFNAMIFCFLLFYNKNNVGVKISKNGPEREVISSKYEIQLCKLMFFDYNDTDVFADQIFCRKKIW